MAVTVNYVDGCRSRDAWVTTPRAEVHDVGATVRVPTIAELLARRLRRRIVRGELSEGDVLPPEAELMAEFSVSRRSLREAFRVLESEGLLRVRRGVHGGAVVQNPNGDIAAGYASLVLEFRAATLGDVLDALLVIEPACAALLARRSAPADVARLHDAHHSATEVFTDGNAPVCAHHEFHTAMIGLVDNHAVSLLGGIVGRIVALATRDHVGSGAARPANRTLVQHGLHAHGLLIEHIEAGDPVGAETTWREHLAEAGRYMLDDADPDPVLDLLG